MAKKKMCTGRLRLDWENAGEHSINWQDAQMGMRPSGVKRKRLKCPKCKRKLMSSVKTCHDGCCVYHSLPPHKPKGWWKKRKKGVHK